LIIHEGKPSFTAEIDAVIRTIETEKPESERLCIGGAFIYIFPAESRNWISFFINWSAK